MRVVVVYFTALILLSGCAARYAASGKVVDTRGQPVSHITVGASGYRDLPDHGEVWSKEVLTDAEGRFAFTAPIKIDNISVLCNDPHAYIQDPPPSGNVIVVRRVLTRR